MERKIYPLSEDSNEITVDEVIQDIGSKVNIKMFLLASLGMLVSPVGVYGSYIMEFVSFVPEIRCLTEKCHNESAGMSGDNVKLTNLICNNTLALQPETDYVLDDSRTSIAVDFNLICSEQKLSLLRSYYFVGGAIALPLCSFFMDLLGRRKLSLIGGTIITSATVWAIFCTSYIQMVMIRILQGMGNYLGYAAGFVWIMEFVPESLRVVYTLWSMLLWAIGMINMSFITYLIRDWRLVFVAISIIYILSYLPLLFLPSSPRHLRSAGNVSQSKKVLKKYALIANVELEYDLNKVNLVLNHKVETEVLSFTDMIRVLLQHKVLVLEGCILFWTWFVLGLLYYGIAYGWNAFGDSPHLNYTYQGISEIVAYLLMALLSKFLGRRFSLIVLFMGTTLLFPIGIIRWKWTDVWNLTRLVSHGALILQTAAFGLTYLYTGEVAPTSHRGKLQNIS